MSRSDKLDLRAWKHGASRLRRSGRLRIRLFEQVVDVFRERWEMVLDRVPDAMMIDRIVAVHENVAKGDDAGVVRDGTQQGRVMAGQARQ